MLFPVSYTPTLSSLFFLVLICLLLIISHGSFTAADGHENISIGAIIDDKSRAGKEQKTAMKIAVQNFNSNSSNHKFTIHFRNNSGDPLQAAVAAEQLIKDEEVQVIIGTQTWQEAALVADIGSRAQVPLISLAAAAITPPLTPRGDSMKTLTGIDRVVNWPGDLTRVPKGWAMPTDAKKMKIGIPGRNAFEKFVKVEPIENSDENIYTGFCIEVFYEVLQVLSRIILCLMISYLIKDLMMRWLNMLSTSGWRYYDTSKSIKIRGIHYAIC